MDKTDVALFKLAIENFDEGVIITGQNNNLQYANLAARRMLNLSEDETICLSDILEAGHARVTAKGYTEIKLGSKIFALRIHNTRLSHLPVKICYITDVTEHLQKEMYLECINTILDSINEGVIASNTDGRLMIYNRQVSQFEGVSPDQMIGKLITEVYNVTTDTSEQLTVLKTGKPIIDVNLNYLSKTGKDTHLTSSTYPIFKEGKIVAAYSISSNITKMRQLILKNMELQEKLFPDNQKILSNGTKYTFQDIMGDSPLIINLVNEAKKAAFSRSPVMIYGETGTGKELFIQSIHNAGPNSEHPFVAINCASIPESLLESLLFGTVKGAFTGAEASKGLFEQAGKGTLFLDEINSMTLPLQAKILRVIQEKSVRKLGATNESPVLCRIMSSTNTDPYRCVANGTLREDLFYRLMVIYLTVPALRERIDDIKILAIYFLKKYAKLYGQKQIKMSPLYCDFLTQHTWPGNVRELEHTLEGSLAMLEEEEDLSLHHIPSHLYSRLRPKNYYYSTLKNPENLSSILREVERTVIIDALQKCNGNITKAAKSIGIGRQNLQYRMHKLKIEKLGGDVAKG